MSRDGEWLFLAVPRGCLRFVIVVFPDHTHLLFLLLKTKGGKEIYSSEPEPKYHSGANSDILGITQLNSPQRCTSGSAFNLCVLQKRPQVKEMCDYSGYRKCKIKILVKLQYCAMR